MSHRKAQAETRRASGPPASSVSPGRRVPCKGRSRVGVSSPHSSIITFGRNPATVLPPHRDSSLPGNTPAGRSPEPRRHPDLDTQDPSSFCLEGAAAVPTPEWRRRMARGHGASSSLPGGQLFSQKSHPNDFCSRNTGQNVVRGLPHSRGARKRSVPPGTLLS